MKAREFAERHLFREARERVMAAKHKTPRDLSEALARVRIDSSVVDLTIERAQKTAEFCSWVLERFRDEEWPGDTKAAIGKRGKWLRELAGIAEEESPQKRSGDF